MSKPKSTKAPKAKAASPYLPLPSQPQLAGSSRFPRVLSLPQAEDRPQGQGDDDKNNEEEGEEGEFGFGSSLLLLSVSL